MTYKNTSINNRVPDCISTLDNDKKPILLENKQNRIISDLMLANRQDVKWRSDPNNCEHLGKGFYLDKTCTHPNPYKRVFEIEDAARKEFMKNTPCPKGQHPSNPFRFGLEYHLISNANVVTYDF